MVAVQVNGTQVKVRNYAEATKLWAEDLITDRELWLAWLKCSLESWRDLLAKAPANREALRMKARRERQIAETEAEIRESK